MKQLTDDGILQIFIPRMVIEKDAAPSWPQEQAGPKFQLEDLVGRTIKGNRQIKTPEGYSGDFRVVEFGDGSVLLEHDFRNHSGIYVAQYFYDEKQVKCLLNYSLQTVALDLF